MTINQSIMVGAVALSVFGNVAPSFALDDPTREPYYAAFAGKKVAYLPITMAANITKSWGAGIKQSLEPLGVEFIVRDGNYSVDATAQAITSLIDEKVDVLIVQNTDVQAFAKLYKRAQKAGIYVIQVGMQSVVQTDAFVGPDWTAMGEKMATVAINQCGDGSGKSGKVALVQGAITSANGIFITQALEAAFSKHPEIQIVANQGSDWDPSKAHAIASTVLQQHPDLCAFLGYWEDEDQGIVAAVKEAKKEEDVFVMTSGIGEQKACDQVANGSFDLSISYDSRTIAQQVVDTVSFLLQAKPEAGSMKALQITPLVELTKESITPRSCWTLSDYVGDSFK